MGDLRAITRWGARVSHVGFRKAVGGFLEIFYPQYMPEGPLSNQENHRRGEKKKFLKPRGDVSHTRNLWGGGCRMLSEGDLEHFRKGS